MRTLADISKMELRELLNKGWMTHDAMWFFHSLTQNGIEKTNVVNTAAIKSMSQIEAKRIRKALQMGEINSFEQLVEFMLNAFEIIKADFMRFNFFSPEKNIIRAVWQPEECFAYQGVKKLGVIDKYQCGIYLRIDTWFEALGVKYEAVPEVNGCLMHQYGKCGRDYKFFFDSTDV